MGKLLKAKEVAKILNVRRQAVWILIRQGKLKAFRVKVTPKGLGDWRVTSEDLREYIDRQYK